VNDETKFARTNFSKRVLFSEFARVILRAVQMRKTIISWPTCGKDFVGKAVRETRRKLVVRRETFGIGF